MCKFSLETNTFDQILVRCSMPIRDLSLSPDKQWVAVASEYVSALEANSKITANR